MYLIVLSKGIQNFKCHFPLYTDAINLLWICLYFNNGLVYTTRYAIQISESMFDINVHANTISFISANKLLAKYISNRNYIWYKDFSLTIRILAKNKVKGYVNEPCQSLKWHKSWMSISFALIKTYHNCGIFLIIL